MKILQISNYYYPHIGGIEQVAHDCAEIFKGRYEQKIFCFNHDKGDSISEVDGVEVVRANCFAKISSQSLSFSYGKLLKKTFKNFCPDLVIFHYPNPFGAHSLLKILKKYPATKLVLYWHLDITKQKILGKLFNGQTKRLIKRAAKVLATSPNYIEGSKFLSTFKEKCDVVSCCVNTHRMNLTEKDRENVTQIREGNRGKIICFALGRHVPYKGTEYLIKASKFLDSSYRIFIAGEGPLTESLKKMAKDDDKIEFLGCADDDTVKSYLNACDIFCFPSITKNEAFGIALAEAMYCNKPPVTFNIPGSGVNYVSLNGVTGIEVENRAVEEYAAAIRTLGEDPQLRRQYGEAAKQRVETLFVYEVIKEKLLDVIESVLNGRVV